MTLIIVIILADKIEGPLLRKSVLPSNVTLYDILCMDIGELL